MWIDKLTIVISLIIAAVFIYRLFSKKQEEHRQSMKALEDKIYKIEYDKREKIDEIYINSKREKQNFIQKELIFCFKCDEETARYYFYVLDETLNIEKFFSANTIKKRKIVLDDAIEEFQERKNNENNCLDQDGMHSEDSLRKNKNDYKTIKERVLKSCVCLILEQSFRYPNCEEEIKVEIERRLNKFVDIEDVEESEINKVSIVLLCDTLFNLLSSGKYHFYRGELDPFGMGPDMKRFYLRLMDLAVELGYNDEKSKNETIKYLEELMKEVG